jgi:aminoglycoside phosphotransferase (APT) family kinase protein
MMHPDQLAIDIGTVRALLAQQFPVWVPLPVRAAPSAGTVNALFRIGDRLVARFPLRSGDVAEVQRWLGAEVESAR